MATDTPQDTAADDARINTVADKALAFGRAAAGPIGEEPFQDPIMHHYFLLFMFGVVDVLGEDDRLGAHLDEIDKKRAMAVMLAKFGTATPEDIVTLVNLLDEAYDEPARRIKAEGEGAARAWRWGENVQAAERFKALMENPDNFPREVKQVLKSDVVASPGPEGSDAEPD